MKKSILIIILSGCTTIFNTKINYMNTKQKVEMEQENSEMIKREDVKNTPFTIISLTDKNEHFAVMGEYRVTEVYKTKEKAKKEVEQITWNRIIQVIMILNEKNVTLKNQK